MEPPLPAAGPRPPEVACATRAEGKAEDPSLCGVDATDPEGGYACTENEDDDVELGATLETSGYRGVRVLADEKLPDGVTSCCCLQYGVTDAPAKLPGGLFQSDALAMALGPVTPPREL